MTNKSAPTDHVTATVVPSLTAIAGEPGQVVTFALTARNAAGDALSGKVYTATSASPSVVRVDSVVGKVVTCTILGQTAGVNVTGHCEGIDSTPIAISSVWVLALLELSPSPVGVAAGNTTTLTATALNTFGLTMPIPSLIGTSSASSVATVGTISGTSVTVSGVGAGTAIIRVKSGLILSNPVTLTVTGGVVLVATSFSVTPASLSVPASGTDLITAQALDQNGDPIARAGLVITWTDTLGSGGSFSAPTSTTNGSGIATVTLTVSSDPAVNHRVHAASGGLVGDSATIDVTPVPVATSLLITPSSLAVLAGGVDPITAQVLDQNGAPMAAAGLVITWSDNLGSGGSFATSTSTTDANGVAHVNFTVSSDPSVNHRIRGVASAVVGTSGIVDVLPVQVATSIRVTPATLSMPASSTQAIVAQILDQLGNPMAAAGLVITWSDNLGSGGSFQTATSTTNVGGAATVNLTATSNPAVSHRIHAVSGGLSGTSAIIDVTPVLVATSIRVTPASLSVTAGNVDPISAQVLDQNGQPFLQAGLVVTWSDALSGAGGFFSSSTSPTNASGVATVNFTVSSDPSVSHQIHAVTGGASGDSFVIDVIPIVGSSRPLVGCIRFDDWSVPNSADSGAQVNILLTTSGYQNRWPYHVNAAVPSMDESPQAIMDNDIQLAKNAGLDFWMFQPFSVKNRYGLNTYLASPNKSLMKFCLMQFKLLLPTSQYVTDGLTLINDPQYLTVNGRPVFFFEMFIMRGLSTPSEVATYRQMIIDAGHPNPYFVGMDLDPATTLATIAAWGLDAASAYAGGVTALAAGLNPYATQVANEEGEWATLKNSGRQVVPSVTTGYDDRWASPTTPHYTGDPTPTEIANHLRNAIAFVQANPAAVPSNLLVLSAWNELNENHYVVPSNTTTSAFGTSRLDAIGAVLNPSGPDRPNEPPGMIRLSPVLDGTVAPPGVWTDLGWVGAGITTAVDTVPGIGLTSVLHIDYLAGQGNGTAPGRCYSQYSAIAQNWPQAIRTLYGAWLYEVSPNFPGSPSANKMMYAQVNGQNNAVMMFETTPDQGSPTTAPMHPKIVLQSILQAGPPVLGSTTAGVFDISQVFVNYGVVMQRGQYFKVEALLVGNTAGQADGSIKMFINGALVLYIPNVAWDRSGAAALWNVWQWDPVYNLAIPAGTVGAYHRMKLLYVSGK